jgi:hypothetical protein
MTRKFNFSDNVREGLSHHGRIREEQASIANLLQEVSQSVKEVTDGKVGVKITDRSPTFAVAKALMRTTSGITGVTVPDGSNDDLVLVAYLVDSQKNASKGLAGWETTSGGYPCKVSFGRTLRIACSEDELGTILGELLASPNVGKALHELATL